MDLTEERKKQEFDKYNVNTIKKRKHDIFQKTLTYYFNKTTEKYESLKKTGVWSYSDCRNQH